ncbi:hypothetical protein BDZ89DRAFT_1220465, partial [Hymenopellis radicata]
PQSRRQSESRYYVVFVLATPVVICAFSVLPNVVVWILNVFKAVSVVRLRVCACFLSGFSPHIPLAAGRLFHLFILYTMADLDAVMQDVRSSHSPAPSPPQTPPPAPDNGSGLISQSSSHAPTSSLVRRADDLRARAAELDQYSPDTYSKFRVAKLKILTGRAALDDLRADPNDSEGVISANLAIDDALAFFETDGPAVSAASASSLAPASPSGSSHSNPSYAQVTTNKCRRVSPEPAAERDALADEIRSLPETVAYFPALVARQDPTEVHAWLHRPHSIFVSPHGFTGCRNDDEKIYLVNKIRDAILPHVKSSVVIVPPYVSDPRVGSGSILFLVELPELGDKDIVSFVAKRAIVGPDFGLHVWPNPFPVSTFVGSLDGTTFDAEDPEHSKLALAAVTKHVVQSEKVYKFLVNNSHFRVDKTVTIIQWREAIARSMRMSPLVVSIPGGVTKSIFHVHMDPISSNPNAVVVPRFRDILSSLVIWTDSWSVGYGYDAMNTPD